MGRRRGVTGFEMLAMRGVSREFGKAIAYLFVQAAQDMLIFRVIPAKAGIQGAKEG